MDIKELFPNNQPQTDLAEESPQAMLIRLLEEQGEDIACAVVIIQKSDGRMTCYRNHIYNTTALGLLEIARAQILESMK